MNGSAIAWLFCISALLCCPRQRTWPRLLTGGYGVRSITSATRSSSMLCGRPGRYSSGGLQSVHVHNACATFQLHVHATQAAQPPLCRAILQLAAGPSGSGPTTYVSHCTAEADLSKSDAPHRATLPHLPPVRPSHLLLMSRSVNIANHGSGRPQHHSALVIPPPTAAPTNNQR